MALWALGQTVSYLGQILPKILMSSRPEFVFLELEIPLLYVSPYQILKCLMNECVMSTLQQEMAKNNLLCTAVATVTSR